MTEDKFRISKENAPVSFPLGQTVVTAAVASVMEGNPAFAKFVQVCMDRHAKGDWGQLSADDRKQNDQGWNNGGQLMSSYPIDPTWGIDGDKLWIITEWDRSVTTVLFPSDY